MPYLQIRILGGGLRSRAAAIAEKMWKTQKIKNRNQKSQPPTLEPSKNWVHSPDKISLQRRDTEW